MLVEFIEDAPHTRREGSKKKFVKGKQYVLDADYAKEFIEAKKAKEVIPLTEDETEKLKRDLTKNKRNKT